MEDRKMSWDAGVKVTYALPNDAATLTAKALADVLSRYDGASYELSIGKEIKGRIFRLTPSLGVRYLDRALTGYYYGVEGSEVRAGRSAYTPHAAVDPFADVVFTCGISEKLIIVTKVGVESLDSQIRNSPIVDENYVLSAAAGLTYRF
jgi:outer membrane protein